MSLADQPDNAHRVKAIDSGTARDNYPIDRLFILRILIDTATEIPTLQGKQIKNTSIQKNVARPEKMSESTPS